MAWLTDEDRQGIKEYIDQGATYEDLGAAGYSDDQLTEFGYSQKPLPNTFQGFGKQVLDDNIFLSGKPSIIARAAAPQQKEIDVSALPSGADPDTDQVIARDDADQPVYQSSLGTQYQLNWVAPEGNIEKERRLAREATERSQKSVGDFAVEGLNNLFNSFIVEPYQSIDRAVKGQATNADVLNVGSIPLGVGATGAVAKNGLEAVTKATPNQLNMFIGPRGASNVSQSLSDLSRAQNMESKGLGKLGGFSTGWFKEPTEGSWTKEISDDKMYVPSGDIIKTANSLLEDVRQTGSVPTLSLGEIVDHEELFSHYPQLKGLEVKIYPKDYLDEVLSSPEDLGAYNPNTETLYVRATTPEKFKYTLAHEVQHAVDRVEWRESGTNPDYIEARLWKELSSLPQEARDYLDAVGSLKQVDALEAEGVFDAATASEWREVATQYAETFKKTVGPKVSDLLDGISDKLGITNVETPEGFDAYSVYRDNLGEVKANLTADRLNWSQEERNKFPVLRKQGEVPTWTSKELDNVFSKLSKLIGAEQ